MKKESKILIKEDLLIDLEFELNNINLTDKEEEEKSYCFILTKLEEWSTCGDDSISKEQLWCLANYLQDSTGTLSDCYMSMISMIETGNYSMS